MIRLLLKPVLIIKELIKEEFDHIMRNVYPVYNTETMKPDWNIPDLFTAMYFQLFYMDPNYAIYRRCAKPECRRAFLVSRTNKKAKYCSDECRTAEAQKRHRKRIKNKETEPNSQL